MKTLLTLLVDITIGLGLLALGLGVFVLRPTFSLDGSVLQPARRPVMLVESDVREGVGGSSGSQRMDAEPIHFGTDASFHTIFPHNILIHRVGIEWPVELLCAIIGHRTKHRAGGVGRMAGERQVFLDQPLRRGYEPHLAALPLDLKCSTPCLLCMSFIRRPQISRRMPW